MNSLRELIDAANGWDSLVNEAMNIVETEERRYGSRFLYISGFSASCVYDQT